MVSVSFAHLAWLGAILATVLLFAATSSAERVDGSPTPTCTHGVSSIGPVVIRNGTVVGGDSTPHTEACLP
jgi:hypothetical protein